MAKRILLIEDYPVVQELYGNALEQAGFTVVVASDGQAALQLLKEDKGDFEYILVDMLLPHVSGSEFLEQYRNRNMKVIVLSDFSDPYTVDKAFSLGVHNYWLKSENTPSQLAEKLTNYPGDDSRSASVKKD